jgi:hypothetical protein
VSDYSRGYSPKDFACKDKDHKPRWVVIVRQANYSAFNGYRRTPSDYSLVKCRTCDRHWRTRAAYVAGLPDAERHEI